MAVCGQLGLHKECTILRINILLAARLTRNGFHHEAFSLSHSICLSFWGKGHTLSRICLSILIRLLPFFLISTCVFFFFSSVASGFFAFTQYHPCISLRWSSQAIFCRTESHHWVDVTKNHNIFHAAQTPSSFSITSSDLNDRTCNLTMTPRTAHTTFIKKTYMTGEDWWQAYWTNAWLILWNGHSLVALRHQNYLSRLRKRWQAK